MAKAPKSAADELILDPNNPNRGTKRGKDMVRKSLERLGAGRSILTSAEGIVIAGNKTLEEARSLKIPIRTVETDGTELVVVKRTDLHYGDPKSKELAMADNRAAQVGLEWDPVVMGELHAEGLLDDGTYFDSLELKGLIDSGAFSTTLPTNASGSATPPSMSHQSAPQTPGSAPKTGPTLADMAPTAADREEEKAQEEPGIYALREDVLFPATNPYGLPELRSDMLADTPPTHIWTGDPTEETQGRMFLYGTSKFPERTEGGVLGFYVDDHRFEVIWNDAVTTMEKFLNYGFASVITPDFSVWRDDPMAVQLWNIYRARWCARYWQEAGIKVIPSLNWGDERSYDFAWIGIPTGAPIVSCQCRTTGSKKGKEFFIQGISEGIRVLEPQSVLMYGGVTHRHWIEPLLPNRNRVNYLWLDDWTSTRMKLRKGK